MTHLKTLKKKEERTQNYRQEKLIKITKEINKIKIKRTIQAIKTNNWRFEKTNKLRLESG